MPEALTVKVKFFTEENGGRKALPKDLLSCGIYRPHFVVGNPEQKKAIVNASNVGQENYLGIVFTAQIELLIAESEITATVLKLYPNEVDYSELVSGAEFTIREGGRVVGNGYVV